MKGAALALALAAAACGGAAPARPRPNVLFVVWDTVRADRTSLYGHERPTTPRTDEWARGARVFDDCRSAAGITVSSHAAMFTGLLPSQSGAHNARPWLDDEHETLAELLRRSGYRTFAWTANPHVSADENFTQGFEEERHPWDPDASERALAIVRAKVAGDSSSELAARLRGGASAWAIKASGELAAPALCEWLERTDDGRPWFAFVNWMEAHRPLVPPRELRRRFLSEEDVERSYALDLSWSALWDYTFGLADMPERDLEVLRGVYDAALLELDGLFADLLARLQERGELARTVVVLTSDHGELLGEHHMLDHQYSLQEELLRVPLAVAGPGIAPGRDGRRATTLDLFPTLLELAGAPLPPAARASRAASLLGPPAAGDAGRLRLAEYPSAFEKPLEERRARPRFDPAPWRRALVAVDDGRHALIEGDDGSAALYRLGRSRRELSAEEPGTLDRLRSRLREQRAALVPWTGGPVPEATEGHAERLRQVGYLGPSDG